MDATLVQVQRPVYPSRLGPAIATLRTLTLVLFGSTAVLFSSTAIRAAPQPVCRALHLQATLDSDLRHVRGTLRCTMASAGAVDLFVYPRLLAQTEELTDIDRLWFYPDGFDAATMQVWFEGPVPKPALPPVAASGPLAAWQDGGIWPAGAEVTVGFVTTLANRQGPLGQRHHVAYLLGGWYPRFGHRSDVALVGLPPDTDQTSWQIDADSLTYRVQFPADRVGFVGRTPFGLSAPRSLSGTFTGGTLPWLVAPAARVYTQPGAVLFVPQNGRGQPPDGGDLLVGRNAVAEADILATLAQGSAFAASQGLAPTNLIAVVAPLRSQLAEPFAGGLAISDRAFHVLPVDVIKKFHRASVWRTQLATLAEPSAARVERALPPALAADAVGMSLTDRLVRRTGARQYVPDILEKFAVTPEVDNLIFAPQVPFVDSYYRAIDDRRSTRLQLATLGSKLAHGGLLYAKLVDWVGPEAALAHTRRYLAGHMDWLTAVGHSFGAEVQAAMTAWLGPYPYIDYEVTQPHSAPQATQVMLQAHGPDKHRVIEPLEVEVKDAHGGTHRERRLGPGLLQFDVSGPVRHIQLDPQNQLLQLWHRPGEGPRFNDRLPPRWRLLLNDVGGVVAATNQQISAFADVSLHRLHDLRYSGLLGVALTPYTISATASGIYNFGGELTPLRLAQSLSLSLSYAYLRPGEGAFWAGNQLSMSLAYLYDDRLSRFSSYTGHGLSAQATAGLTRLGPNATQAFYGIGLSGLHIWPFGLGQALLLRLRGDTTFGQVPDQSTLRLGGRYLGGRGFESDEQTARSRVIASGEYRHVLGGDAKMDFFGALTLTRLDGALFADAIYLPGAQPACSHAMFYDVGYGIRFMAEMLNMSPVSLQIDIGLPLNRCANETGRLPFAIYLAFVQSFFSF